MERLKISSNVFVEDSLLEKMTREVLNNTEAVIELRKRGIDDSMIKDNIGKIYDFANDLKICKNCVRMENCQKETKCLVSEVFVINGVVDNKLTPCKKYLAKVNMENRYLVTDFPEKWINGDKLYEKETKKEIILKYGDFVSGKNKEWIYIKSMISNGKSFLAAKLCEQSAKTGSFNSIAFINTPNRFKELADLAFAKNPKFETELEKYKNVEMLVLDDFGNEFKSDFVRDNILYPILAHRSKNNLFTVFTSNYSIDDVVDMYLTNHSCKPKIEQIRNLLKNKCDKEFNLKSQPM